MAEWTKTIQSSSGPVVTTLVALFRAVVSLRIISANFAFNPAVSSNVIRSAADANRPARFLPQPWPTVDTATPQGVRTATLLKMKSDLSSLYGTGVSTSTEIAAKIKEMFPEIDPNKQGAEHALLTTVTMLTEAGNVLFEFDYPSTGQLPLESPSDPTTALIDYVTLMVILTLTQEIELTGV